MKTHTFKIKAGLASRDSKIELDGHELTDVVRVSFELSATGITTLKLDIVGAILVEGEFRESAILQVAQAAFPPGHSNA
jgi:hypothetical protein